MDYITGIQILKSKINILSPERIVEFSVLEERLYRNLREDEYGVSDNVQHERNKIVESLNLYAQENLSVSYEELCPAGRIDLALWNVPKLPSYYVEDKELIDSWRKTICNDEMNAPRIFGINGIPGVGKTTLAIALATDKGIQEYYKNTILWASLGPDVKSLDDLRPIIFAWGTAMNLELPFQLPTQALLAIFAKNLSKKKTFLVLDDIWFYLPAKHAIDSCGNKTLVLLTSRDEDILIALNAQIRLLDVMSPTKATELLQKHVNRTIPDTDLQITTELLSRAGNLPLAISLIGAQARRGTGWSELLKVFRAGQPPLDLIDYSRPESREQSLRISFDLTYSKLNHDDQRRYRQLGVMASSQPFLLDDAAAIWAGYDSKDQAAMFADDWERNRDIAGRILRDFCSLSILEHVGEPQSEVYQQHPLLRLDSLRRLLPEELSLAVETHAKWVYTILSQYIDQQYYHVFERIGPQIYSVLRRLKRSYNDEDGLQVLSPNDARLWMNNIVLQLSDLWMQQRKWDDLNEWIPEAIGCCQIVGDRNGEGLHIGNLGSYFLNKQEFKKAEELLINSNELLRQAGNQRAEITNLLNLTAIYQQTGRIESAINTSRRGYEIARSINDIGKQAESLGALGLHYHNSHQLREAKEYLQQALELARHQEKKSILRNILHSLGKIYLVSEEPNIALEYLKEALRLNQNFIDYHVRTGILILTGDAFLQLREIKNAEGCYKQALHDAEVLKDLNSLADGYHGLARAALVRKNRKQAIQYIDKALEIDRQLDDSEGEIGSLKILFSVYVELNRNNDARKILDQINSKALEANLEKDLDWYYEISPLFNAQEDLDGSIEAARNGLKRAVSKGHHGDTIKMLMLLGKISKSTNARILYLMRALVRAEKIGNQESELAVLIEMANIYKHFDTFFSFNYLAKAKALANKLGNQTSLKDVIKIQKEVLKKEGRPENLIEFIDIPVMPENDDLITSTSPFKAAALVVEARNGQEEYFKDAEENILALSTPVVVMSDNPGNMAAYPLVLRKVLNGYKMDQVLSDSPENLSPYILAIFDQID